MTIREFDSQLYRQLQMCIDGRYVSIGGDAASAVTLAGVRSSLEVANIGRRCDCGEPSCRSFGVAGANVSRESLRLRFRVHGELSVVCTAVGEIQHIDWLPEPPHGRRAHAYEVRDGGFREVGICPYPE